MDGEREAEHFGAWMDLLQANAVVAEALEDRLQAECDLSLAEHEALSRLFAAPEGSLRMAELAGLMLVSKSGVTRLVDRLVERHLVERGLCETDRRVTYAVITADGRAIVERSRPVLASALAESFSRHLGDGDVGNLRRALHKVLAGNGKWEESRCSPELHRAQAGQTEHVAG
jgi:DNA-binding MarR family transcriptional regulator